MNKLNVKAVISLVIGIISLFILHFGIIVGIIGIVVAKKSLNEIKLKNENGRGLAIAGLTTSILGIVIQSILLIAAIIGYTALFN